MAVLLAPQERSQLDRALADFERETSHQVVVLTVRSLEGEAIEGFSLRVVEAWKLGREDADNGVLIVVSSGDRRARIEVGYGLEGVIPDAIASRIIRNRMIPSFREGRMGEGIVRGAEAVMAAARGEKVEFDADAESEDPVGLVFFCGIIGGFLGAAAARKTRIGGSLLGAAVGFGLAYLIVQLIFESFFAGLVGAFFATVWGSSGSGRGSVVHLPGGRWGGGGIGGGGFGGGFGGGGGGFGGGGASGSW